MSGRKFQSGKRVSGGRVREEWTTDAAKTATEEGFGSVGGYLASFLIKDLSAHSVLNIEEKELGTSICIYLGNEYWHCSISALCRSGRSFLEAVCARMLPHRDNTEQLVCYEEEIHSITWVGREPWGSTLWYDLYYNKYVWIHVWHRNDCEGSRQDSLLREDGSHLQPY